MGLLWNGIYQGGGNNMKQSIWTMLFMLILAMGMLFGWSVKTQATELEPGEQVEKAEEENPETATEEGSRGDEAEQVIQQTPLLTGKSSYNLQYKAKKTIALNVGSTGNGELTFLSSNRKVAVVSAEGIVTLKGAGVCQITVKAGETEEYKAAEKTIRITVWKQVVHTGYSSSYKSTKYYRKLKKLKLLDDKKENIVKVAASQVGYRESNSRKNLRGSQKGKRNYTEYGRYYGMNGVAWCAIFVNWVARQNGIPRSVIPKYCAVRQYYSYYHRRGLTHSWSSVRKRKYLPQKGDIILYSYSRGATTHHIGYVESAKYKFGKFHIVTIEGNTKNAVRRVKMTLKKNNTRGKIGSKYITAFASPRY